MPSHSSHNVSVSTRNRVEWNVPKLFFLLLEISLPISVLLTVLAPSIGMRSSTPQARTSWLVAAAESIANSSDSGEKVCDRFVECTPWRNPQQHEPPTISGSDGVCGVWLAPSSIPGAGWGVFAGKDYPKGTAIGQSGDIIIPIVDLDIHQPGRKIGQWVNTWDDYVWQGDLLQMADEGWEEVLGASPGISAAMNCFMDLTNAADWQPYNNMLLDGRHDPGAGAITTYDKRWTVTLRNVRAGEELFVNYGNDWFYVRRHLGPIPLSGDLERATALFRRYQELTTKYSASTATGKNKAGSSTLWKDLWTTFVIESAWKPKSRTLGAFNASIADAELKALQQIYNGSLFDLRRSQTKRDQRWLEQHGVCVDHLRDGPSSLPQAGRGAFSTRFLSKGTVVAPLPMVHLTYDRRLNLYALTRDAKGNRVIQEPKRVTGKQLLLNYCYGHENSTMLLCPYASYANVVNHNQTLANVRLQWADPAKSILNVSLLQQSIKYIDEQVRKAVFAMELIATRDINEGEEIFLDYGDAWEAAWRRHVQNWQPVSKSFSAGHWNKDRTTRLRTVFEQIGYPYPPNVELKCDRAFGYDNRFDWEPLGNEPNATAAFELYRHWTTEILTSCDVLRWRHDGHRILYTALFNRSDASNDVVSNENYALVKDLPRDAFVFADQPYTSDMFASNAFRHAIMIPNDIFPEAWKNRNSSSKTDASNF